MSRVTEPMSRLLSLVEDIKDKLNDKEYKDIMDTMKEVHESVSPVDSNREQEQTIENLTTVVYVLEEFLDGRMGDFEGADNRPTKQFMQRYPDEWAPLMYDRYGEIDEVE